MRRGEGGESVGRGGCDGLDIILPGDKLLSKCGLFGEAHRRVFLRHRYTTRLLAHHSENRFRLLRLRRVQLHIHPFEALYSHTLRIMY